MSVYSDTSGVTQSIDYTYYPGLLLPGDKQICAKAYYVPGPGQQAYSIKYTNRQLYPKLVDGIIVIINH